MALNPLRPTGIVSTRQRGGSMVDGGGDETGEVPAPAAITRTSGELLGRRPLPRLLTTRPVTFLLGPVGVGKTSVARRLLGEERRECAEACYRRGLIAAAGGAWPEPARLSPSLLLDEVDCLHGRWGAVDLLGALLRERVARGLHTVVAQGQVDQSVTLLYGQLPLSARATVLLRFPVGRGRRRYVLERCVARGIDYALARPAVTLEPWSYNTVEAFLDEIVAKSR